MKVEDLVIGEVYEVEWMPTVWPYTHTGKLLRIQNGYLYFDSNDGDKSYVPVRINSIRYIN